MAEMNEKEVQTAPESKQPKAKKEKPVEKKPNFFVKAGRFFARAGKAIAKFFLNIVSELRKVVWTSKEDLFKNSVLVVVAVAVFATAVGLITYFGFSLFDFLSGLIGFDPA